MKEFCTFFFSLHRQWLVLRMARAKQPLPCLSGMFPYGWGYSMCVIILLPKSIDTLINQHVCVFAVCELSFEAIQSLLILKECFLFLLFVVYLLELLGVIEQIEVDWLQHLINCGAIFECFWNISLINILHFLRIIGSNLPDVVDIFLRFKI